jgi:hypothetical protein
MTPSEAVEKADWIGPRLHPFKAYDVGMVIPTGFDAYARILHPAGGEGITRDVRWSELARWSHKTIHPEVQFVPITEPAPGFGTGQQPWRYPPMEGTLEAKQVEVLVALLAKHTATPEACWFCLWEGYGYLHAGGMAPQTAVFVRGPRPLAWFRLWAARRRLWRIKPRRPSSPRVNLPNRGYLLFAGPVQDAAGWEDGPNLWWPDDRAWCVASEIDFGYSYVGGSNELIKEVLTHPALEAVPADLGDGIRYDSDKLNSTGARERSTLDP